MVMSPEFCLRIDYLSCANTSRWAQFRWNDLGFDLRIKSMYQVNKLKTMDLNLASMSTYFWWNFKESTAIKLFSALLELILQENNWMNKKIK